MKTPAPHRLLPALLALAAAIMPGSATADASPPRLKAYHTRLPFDDHGAAGKYADIIVEVPPRGRFIFSREFGYQPYWMPVDRKQHLVTRLIPRLGDGPDERPDNHNIACNAAIVAQSEAIIYLNGKPVETTGGVSTTSAATHTGLSIGMTRSLRQFPQFAERAVTKQFKTTMVFSGLIDEVKLFDMPLDDLSGWHLRPAPARPQQHRQGHLGNNIEAMVIYGLTDKSPSELTALNRSWNFAPGVTATKGCEFRSYEKRERAFQFTRTGDTIEFTVHATREQPLANPAFVIARWGSPDDDISLKLNGQARHRGADFHSGIEVDPDGTYTLVVWMPLAAGGRTTCELSS